MLGAITHHHHFEKSIEMAKIMGLLSYKDDKLLKNYERWEFEEKLKEFKLPIPWK